MNQSINQSFIHSVQPINKYYLKNTFVFAVFRINVLDAVKLGTNKIPYGLSLFCLPKHRDQKHAILTNHSKQVYHRTLLDSMFNSSFESVHFIYPDIDSMLLEKQIYSGLQLTFGAVDVVCDVKCLFEGLVIVDGEDDNKGVVVGDIHLSHGRELVLAGGIHDLIQVVDPV